MIAVTDSFKLGEGIGCKEGASLSIFDCGVEGIPGGNLLGTNVRNDEYISIYISK